MWTQIFPFPWETYWMVLLPFPFSWIRNYRKKIGWRRVWAYFFFGRFIKLEILEILEDICDFIFFFLNIVEMISSWVFIGIFYFYLVSSIISNFFSKAYMKKQMQSIKLETVKRNIEILIVKRASYKNKYKVYIKCLLLIEWQQVVH